MTTNDWQRTQLPLLRPRYNVHRSNLVYDEAIWPVYDAAVFTRPATAADEERVSEKSNIIAAPICVHHRRLMSLITPTTHLQVRDQTSAEASAVGTLHLNCHLIDTSM